MAHGRADWQDGGGGATAHLELEPFANVDADELLAVFRAPDVRRFLLDDALVTLAWVHDEITASEERSARSGTGLWSIRLVDAPGIIGFAGFRPFFEPPELQLLYGLLPAHWGRGLATEAAEAICDRAFTSLGLDEVAAAVDIPNKASLRVLHRLGMTRTRTSPDGAAGTAFFTLTRDAWSSRQRN